MTREKSLRDVAPAAKYSVREGGHGQSRKSTCTLVPFQQRAAFLTAWWVDAEIALSAIEGNSEVAS